MIKDFSVVVPNAHTGKGCHTSILFNESPQTKVLKMLANGMSCLIAITFFLKAFSLNEYIWPDNCIKILVIFSVVMVACGMTSLLQKSAELLFLSRLGSIMCFSFACAALHQLVKTNRLNEKSSHPATKGVNSLRGFQSLITHCKSLSRQLLNAI